MLLCHSHPATRSRFLYPAALSGSGLISSRVSNLRPMQFRQHCGSIVAREVTYGGKIVITPASAWLAGGGSEGTNHRRVKLIIPYIPEPKRTGRERVDGCVFCTHAIRNNQAGACRLRPYMRRYAHAKREHAITSLDALLFELFALSYLLDPVILRFLFRAAAQAQFSRPRDLDRSLRFMFIYCSLVNVGPVFRHLLPSFHYETRGLLLDFVGRSTPPARAHLVCLDIGIFVLQTLCLFIAYEAHDNSEQDELAYVPEQAPNDSCSNLIAEDGSPEKLDDNAPILHLRLRKSFRKIYQSPSEHPPPSNASNLPLPNTTRRTNTISSSASPMSRLVTMVQRRLEQQRASREPGAGNGEIRTSSMPGGMVGA